LVGWRFDAAGVGGTASERDEENETARMMGNITENPRAKKAAQKHVLKLVYTETVGPIAVDTGSPFFPGRQAICCAVLV